MNTLQGIYIFIYLLMLLGLQAKLAALVKNGGGENEAFIDLNVY